MRISMRSWRLTLPVLAALAWTTNGAGILPAGSASAQQPLGAVELAQPIEPEPAPNGLPESGSAESGAAEPAPAPEETAPPEPNAEEPGDSGEAPLDAAPSEAQSTNDAVVELIKERYPNGTIKVEREMAQDSEGSYVLHGAWRMFDEQGRLIIDGHHERNHKVGLWRRFYRGTEVPLLATAPYKDFSAPFISQATFHAGQFHGKWTITDSKQRKVHEIEFSDGERHGKATWFYPNGAIMLQAQYEHGRVNGDVMKFGPDSSLLAQENYQAGRKLAPRVEFHDAERKIKKLETVVLHGSLAIKAPDNWDTCTLAAFEVRGVDEKHGPFSTWHPNGQIAKQGEFRYNLPVGKVTYWFENGQLQMEGMYVDGRQEGVWTWWHANGQKAITGEYRDATPIGKWNWWQADGKLAQRADLSNRPLAAPSPTPEADSEMREAKQQQLRQLQLIEPGLPMR